MLKLLVVCITIVLILVVVDSSLTSSMTEIKKITVGNKYTDGDLYIIDTVSMDRYATTSNIYNTLEIGKTYTVKIFSKNIWEVVNEH